MYIIRIIIINSEKIKEVNLSTNSLKEKNSFGMVMPLRKFAQGNGGYRFGFNGKELDKETSSTTTYDYGFRIYSPALGRFLSVDPLIQKYPWYTPYQFAGNDVIRNIDLDGKEPWLRTTVKTISKYKSAITAVSASFTMEAAGVLSFASGMAVDPNGNVLSFTQKGGLLGIQFGISTNAGIGVAGNITVYNDRITSLDKLLGRGSVGGASIGWKEVVSIGSVTEYNDGIVVGETFSMGLGFSAMPAGGIYQKSVTTGIILTGEEYDKVYNDRKNAESRAAEDVKQYDYDQAIWAGEQQGRLNFPNYAKALFIAQSSIVTTDYIPVEGKENTFEISYKYSLRYIPQPTVNPNGKAVTITKTFNTGVQVVSDGNGNYISPNYKPTN